MAERHDPDSSRPGANPGPACEPGQGPGGPPREGGGTTGDGNLSPQGASRTGGATSGVGTDDQRPSRAGTIPPDA
jgi:hypothetical protein